MTTVEHIIEMVKRLSPEDRAALKVALNNPEKAGSNELEKFVTEERYAKGRACLHCGSVHVVRNGHQKNGTQRYLCKDCEKSFEATTNSIVSGTRKDLSTWEKHVECMMNGLSIRKTAEICGIHRNTAFYWRHKILDALQDMAEAVELDGIVEMDETFFPVSYKGNHKMSKFEMPREAHHRGKEIHTRGLSHEQVCVPCAVNRSGLSIAKVSNLGRVSAANIHGVFDGRIDSEATLVTDTMNAYVRFANDTGHELVQLKGGKAKRGIYNIQSINSYHSRLKKFMRNFNGVASKYLNNYLIWNNFVNYARETAGEKKNVMLRFVTSVLKTVHCKKISSRVAIPVIA